MEKRLKEAGISTEQLGEHELVRPPHSKALSTSRKISKFLGSKLASTELLGALFFNTVQRL